MNSGGNQGRHADEDQRFLSERLPVSFATLLTTLYFAQGLPSGFFAHALPALMREQGVSLTYISLAKLLALPWFLKCFWAPLVDRRGYLPMGHYRSWIVLLQSLCILPLMLLSSLHPQSLFSTDFLLFIAVAILINACMATQDVATDALAVRLLPLRWRGLGNSIQVAGYKLGMLAGGNGLLLLMAAVGWAESFRAVALGLLLLLIPILLFREPAWVAAQEKAPEASTAFWREWPSLFSSPSMRTWLPVLLTYKLADAIGSGMVKPLLIDAGFSLAEVGEIGLMSSLAGLVAAFAGGLACRWLGAWRALFYAGFLQAVGIALYALVAMGASSATEVYAISLFEQMADAVSTVSLFAVMMGYCRTGHEGGDYTVQMAVFSLLSGTVALASGALASLAGLPLFFLGSGVMGVASLYFVWRASHMIFPVE